MRLTECHHMWSRHVFVFDLEDLEPYEQVCTASGSAIGSAGRGGDHSPCGKCGLPSNKMALIT